MLKKFRNFILNVPANRNFTGRKPVVAILFGLVSLLLYQQSGFAGSSPDKPANDTIKPPVTILIDTCPAPQTIAVPVKPGGSYVKYLKSGQVTIMPPERIPLAVLKNKKGKAIKDANGNPFILGEAGGISYMQQYTATEGLYSSVAVIYRDKTGNLWFGTQGGGVSRYDGKSFTSFTTAQGLAGNTVISIAEDKTGNLWFGTYGGGVSRYDGKSFTSFTTAHGLAGNVVWSIAEDKTGNLWFGTNGGGVSRYDPSDEHGAGGKSFTSFTTTQGLAGNVVLSIAEDKTGNLWFGTNGGGVSRYDGKSFTSFTTAQGLAGNSVYSIAEDKTGNLWFGTNGGGVSRYDGKSFTSFTTAHGLAGNGV